MRSRIPLLFMVAILALVGTVGLIGQAGNALMAAPVVVAEETPLTTFFVVRHAEKLKTPGERDPELSAKGKQRAEKLARVLADVELKGVFSTGYRRTIDTVTPIAKAKGLEVSRYPAGATKQFGAKLLAGRKGGSYLVVGHSNTVPSMLEGLGVSDEIKLTDDDYDNLFCVIVDGQGKATLRRLHYGAQGK